MRLMVTLNARKWALKNEKSLIWCCYVYRKRQSILENGGERREVESPNLFGDLFKELET